MCTNLWMFTGNSRSILFEPFKKWFLSRKHIDSYLMVFIILHKMLNVHFLNLVHCTYMFHWIQHKILSFYFILVFSFCLFFSIKRTAYSVDERNTISNYYLDLLHNIFVSVVLFYFISFFIIRSNRQLATSYFIFIP